MKNKTIGALLISSVVIAIVALFAEDYFYNLSEFLYAIAGCGMLVFGIWGGARLTKDVG